MNIRFIYMRSSIVLLLIGLQTLSHSQYYPTSSSRHHPRSYVPVHPFQTTTLVSPDIEIFRKHNPDRLEVSSEHENYRRRFNGRITTESFSSAEYNPDSPSPRPPASRPQQTHFESDGVGITLQDDGVMRILIPGDTAEEPEPPLYRPEVISRRRYPESRVLDVDTGSLERPPETLVVVIHGRRPSISSSSFNPPLGTTSLTCPSTHLRSRTDGQCYYRGAEGPNGPCGRNMKFYPVKGNPVYGYCDCAETNGFVVRPYAWWQAHDACYPLYTRGPCGYNQWMILDGNGMPRCAPRKCPHDFTVNEETSREFWFLHGGKCYKTGNHYSRFCGIGDENKNVWFTYGQSEPQCLKAPPDPKSRAVLAPVTDLPCRSGYKRMQNGECKRKARFDDDYQY